MRHFCSTTAPHRAPLQTRPSTLVALLGVTMLAGCAELNTAHRTRPVSANTPTVITVDAKQRHMLMVPEVEEQFQTGELAKRTSSMRVCAEAAPDVFSAMAASGTLDLSAGAKSPSGGANIGAGFAASETAAAIRRTQTVNLARESFYRTCERYLSGAIGKTAFGVQAARDFRQAIAMLAIEQLTGVLQGPSTIISAGSTNAAQTDPEEYYRQLQASSTKLAEAKATLTSAKAAADPAKAPCKAEDVEKPEEKKTREAGCAAKEAAVKSAETAVDAAQTNHDALLAMSKNGAPQAGIIAGTVAGNVTPDGGVQAAPAHAEKVALAVQTIAMKAMDTDETLMFCLQALSGVDPILTSNVEKSIDGSPAGAPASVKASCLLYMNSDLRAKSAENFIQAERAFQEYQSDTERLALLIDATRNNEAKFQKLIKSVRTTNRGFCKTLAGDLDAAQCAASVRRGAEFRGNSDGLRTAVENASKA